MYIVGIGKTTFCTQFARTFVGRDGSIRQFMTHQHNSRSAQLFVTLLKQIVDHSLTIGVDFEHLCSFFPITATLTDINVTIAKLMLLFGLKKYEGCAISYEVCELGVANRALLTSTLGPLI